MGYQKFGPLPPRREEGYVKRELLRLNKEFPHLKRKDLAGLIGCRTDTVSDYARAMGLTIPYERGYESRSSKKHDVVVRIYFDQETRDKLFYRFPVRGVSEFIRECVEQKLAEMEIHEHVTRVRAEADHDS